MAVPKAHMGTEVEVLSSLGWWELAVRRLLGVRERRSAEGRAATGCTLH